MHLTAYGVKVLRFPSQEACAGYIATHNLLAMPSYQGRYYIAVCFLTAGVFGVSSPTTRELLSRCEAAGARSGVDYTVD